MRSGLRFRDLPGRKIRKADVADLARGHQVVEPAQGFLDRRGAIPEMQPVDIDIIGLEAAQRRFALLYQCLAAGAAAVRIALEQAAIEFCADHATVPASLL